MSDRPGIHRPKALSGEPHSSAPIASPGSARRAESDRGGVAASVAPGCGSAWGSGRGFVASRPTPDKLAVLVNLTDAVERNPPGGSGLINELKGVPLVFGEDDPLQGNPVQSPFAPVEETNFESPLAKRRVPADAIQQFVDRGHSAASRGTRRGILRRSPHSTLGRLNWPQIKSASITTRRVNHGRRARRRQTAKPPGGSACRRTAVGSPRTPIWGCRRFARPAWRRWR